MSERFGFKKLAPQLYTVVHICKGCGHVYGELPKARTDCPVKGCRWMIFSDGTQLHEYPME